ncbi:MAG: D-aminoacylase [Cyclobacteriaceae bacterium]|nr:D-aminoacylase [Cyclobacteriaceae bacterium]
MNLKLPLRLSVLCACCVLIIVAFRNRFTPSTFDIIIRQGTIYDGSGSKPFIADLAIQGDSIAAIGNLSDAIGRREINANGLVVSPGFINMLSWADQNLLKDGLSMANIKQGVTLEIFGEGWSPGPVKRKTTQRADSLWTTLGGYFQWLMKKGVSPNVASFVGQTSVRNYVMGYENRKPTAAELDAMKSLVKQAMEEGALGLGTSLIYAPASYASTEELIALATVAAQHGGMYTTHMRSEGDFILEALNETFRIAHTAQIPAEIYHLKINIARNWDKLNILINKIDSAQKAGLKITANMYPYTASGTGLTSRLPLWVQEGGAKEMRKRLRTPSIRKKVLLEMQKGIPYKNSDPKDVMIMGFRLDSLNKLYRGKRLDEIARLHGKNADETTIDLIVRDKSRIEAIYFLISEDNMKRMLHLPYVSFGSDAGSQAIPENAEEQGVHPRTYGTFARVLGKYVRDEKVIPMEEAIRRMTALPARNLNIRKRGTLTIGNFADVAIFDPATVQDHATFENPHQYATGMIHVLINGKFVLYEGEHTGTTPGRFIRGQGSKRP